GVALASLLAEFGAMGLGLAIVARALKSHGGAWDWARIGSRGHLVVLLRANLDIFVRTLCLLGAFAYFTAQSAKMGDVLLAGNAILLQLQNFTAYGLDGFAHAVEVLAGNALGARSRKAFREAVRVSTLWALGTASLVSGLYLVLGGSVVGLFTDLAAVRAAAETYLPWVVVAPVVSVWSFQLDGIFIGTTRTAEMRNAMLLSLFVYLGACWILVPTLGNHGLWLAFTVLMVARAASLGLLYPRLERLVASKG
ncbi:MAG: MATE family efflux transporter, partial [Rhodospirillales bacterium]|nr:MATE family efflux transporter [Rhodospirillales bacterium]